jgi:transposase InsO family protein
MVKHHWWYDSPRVQEALRDDYGKRISRKKVAQLMREHSFQVCRRRNFIPTTRSDHGFAICENLLNRKFHAG